MFPRNRKHLLAIMGSEETTMVANNNKGMADKK